jgi:hypothetical protein
MTNHDKGFVFEYRDKFKGDKKLPCLKCSDRRILACSKIKLNGKIGCVKFNKYVSPRDGRR